MASDDAGEIADLSVPTEVRRWLEDRADELGVDTTQFVRRLLAAHSRLDDGDPLDLDEADRPDEYAAESDVEELRDEFQELLEDVRNRVIQVKRETDGKAPADHEHEAIAEDLDDVRTELEALEDDLTDHRDTLSDLQETVDGGFENFEEVLEYLLETTDDLAERTDRLARATIGTRERVNEFAASVEERDAADRLKKDAALEGITSAECADCGRSIRAALLTAPECPYCAASIVDVEPKRGILGSATFQTGDRPALVGSGDDPITEDLEADVERERPDPADVDWDTAGDREE